MEPNPNPTPGQREKTSWNIAAQQAQQIAALLRKSINHQLRCEIIPWRMTLLVIRESVNYGMTTAERKRFDNMEKDIAHIKIKKDERDAFHEKLDKKTTETIYFALRNYQRELLDTLFALGFFPSKEDRTKLSF